MQAEKELFGKLIEILKARMGKTLNNTVVRFLTVRRFEQI